MPLFNAPPSFTSPNTLITSVTQTTTSRAATEANEMFAANPDRKGLTVSNQNSGNLYLLFGTAGQVTATNNHVIIAPNAYYEVPFAWIGAIGYVSDTGNGNPGNIVWCEFT